MNADARRSEAKPILNCVDLRTVTYRAPRAKGRTEQVEQSFTGVRLKFKQDVPGGTCCRMADYVESGALVPKADRTAHHAQGRALPLKRGISPADRTRQVFEHPYGISSSFSSPG